MGGMPFSVEKGGVNGYWKLNSSPVEEKSASALN